jgi:hypothetical protein
MLVSVLEEHVSIWTRVVVLVLLLLVKLAPHLLQDLCDVRLGPAFRTEVPAETGCSYALFPCHLAANGRLSGSPIRILRSCLVTATRLFAYACCAGCWHACN